MTEPTHIGRALSDAARSLGIDSPRAAARVFNSWAEIAGESVAAQCRPVALRNRVLELEASSPAWAAQMRYLGPEIARRTNAALGFAAVERVVCRVTRPGAADVSREWASPQEASAERFEPPPPRWAARASGLSASVPDKRLAAALQRAMLAVKGRRRRGGQ